MTEYQETVEMIALNYYYKDTNDLFGFSGIFYYSIKFILSLFQQSHAVIIKIFHIISVLLRRIIFKIQK